MQQTNSSTNASAATTAQNEQEFRVGEIVTVDWEKLGEITEYLWNGYYRVWVETDYAHSEYVTAHAKRLDRNGNGGEE